MALITSSARIFSSQSLSRYLLHRCASSASSPLTSGAEEHKVVVSSNGSTIVCWHPEQDFPYECSKPLPAEESLTDQTALRAPFTDALDASLQGVQRYKHMFVRRSDKQVREELMKLTHTNKHIWFPHTGVKYRKKNPPRDREYM
ncbi:39S ribosomal protein L42, mitochondrial-like [Amphibalanus amphitrite]|uniref:39S ribosomal protein L42, mitochondrial-like n=1 Tax=Amphibalanus amphitrite TaxID=1232801 RepID=UPI001C902961|nr:39S ribosomal protein L42, mitochondrial-like [Amphibalanus amphitrite]XP_043234729.1 39S ribosomal protein L42, mitochondrial-like [Amphibalanus amphitrite]XP_043234730.1 39S ribosomal protein L42, mitochondrial-like [Amphibalanus amphitrite]XP_043234731.1 39S ribosomal protein L42, mitochondrial-like [Amphibalanus amphitrite]XP_043234732.1 39S ribosomal protein L42, mitochondrial-like [Amphibalanus amphitrite]XP_043234733.1 39S ribosomal protein L42, mitochondrial-like [Amphibalanus amphi